ncbi:MAG: hypothetical protein ACKOCB_07885 [Planctomycetia bacterium]
MVHLDELHDKFGTKGLKVLAITNEARSAVDGFVAKTSARHGIVIEATDSATAFEIRGFPTMFLLGPDGKILGVNPSDQQIEQSLSLVRIPPELPRTLLAVSGALKKEKYAEARAKAQAALDGGTLPSDEDKKAATDIVAWIDWLAQGGLDTARVHGEKGRWYEARLALEDVKKSFKGLPQSVEADTQIKAMLADKAKKDEISAWERLVKAKQAQLDKDLKPKEALPLFKAIANKYDETRAGKAAAELVKQLEAAIEAK